MNVKAFKELIRSYRYLVSRSDLISLSELQAWSTAPKYEILIPKLAEEIHENNDCKENCHYCNNK